MFQNHIELSVLLFYICDIFIKHSLENRIRRCKLLYKTSSQRETLCSTGGVNFRVKTSGIYLNTIEKWSKA